MSRRGGHRLGERLRSVYLWHRWIGLLAAPVLVCVVLTGIALNHVERLGLDQRFVSAPILLQRYGLDADEGPVPSAIATAAGPVAVLRGRLYLGERRIAEFDGTLRGAVTGGGLLAAFGDAGWLLATTDGQLIERGVATDLPLVPDRATLSAERLCIGDGRRSWCSADFGIGWQPCEDCTLPRFERATVDARLMAAWRADSLRDRISWARVLGDLHSGRLFGGAGVLVVDAAAVLLLALALSGPWLWWRQHRRRRRRREHRR